MLCCSSTPPAGRRSSSTAARPTAPSSTGSGSSLGRTSRSGGRGAGASRGCTSAADDRAALLWPGEGPAVLDSDFCTAALFGVQDEGPITLGRGLGMGPWVRRPDGRGAGSQAIMGSQGLAAGWGGRAVADHGGHSDWLCFPPPKPPYFTFCSMIAWLPAPLRSPQLWGSPRLFQPLPNPETAGSATLSALARAAECTSWPAPRA